MNGAFASFASRRAISVLPTPVGPIIKMFFGVISPRSGSAICARRQRLRNAIATARFASAWPMMCLSSSSTIARGGLRVRAAGADREQLVLGLDHVAGSGDQERLRLVRDDQERL